VIGSMMIRWVGYAACAPNLTLEPVDGADAEPYFPYHFANPDALGEFAPRKRYLVGFGTGAPQLPAHLPSLAHKLAVAGELFLYDAEPSPDTLADHRALEFGEGAGHLEQQLARRGGGIDRLLVQVEIDADGLKVLDGAQQVDRRSAEPVDGPCHDDIELASAGILEQGIEAGPLISSLGATDAVQPRRPTTSLSSRIWFSTDWWPVLTRT
jgi:hypothetical protein